MIHSTRIFLESPFIGKFQVPKKWLFKKPASITQLKQKWSQLLLIISFPVFELLRFSILPCNQIFDRLNLVFILWLVDQDVALDRFCRPISVVFFVVVFEAELFVQIEVSKWNVRAKLYFGKLK